MATYVKESAPPLEDKTFTPDEKSIASRQLTYSDDLGAAHDINEKALVRKLDRKLLPAVTMLYLLSFLDRSNGAYSPLHVRASIITDFHTNCQRAS